MRRLTETAWDDLDHDVEATRKDVGLSFDGYAVTLDLSEGSYEQIAYMLKDALSAGSPVKVKRQISGGKYAAMRAWGDKHGLGEGIGYLKTAAGYSYRNILKEAFKKRQASG